MSVQILVILTFYIALAVIYFTRINNQKKMTGILALFFIVLVSWCSWKYSAIVPQLQLTPDSWHLGIDWITMDANIQKILNLGLILIVSMAVCVEKIDFREKILATLYPFVFFSPISYGGFGFLYLMITIASYDLDDGYRKYLPSLLAFIALVFEILLYTVGPNYFLEIQTLQNLLLTFVVLNLILSTKFSHFGRMINLLLAITLLKVSDSLNSYVYGLAFIGLVTVLFMVIKQMNFQVMLKFASIALFAVVVVNKESVLIYGFLMFLIIMLSDKNLSIPTRISIESNVYKLALENRYVLLFSALAFLCHMGIVAKYKIVSLESTFIFIPIVMLGGYFYLLRNVYDLQKNNVYTTYYLSSLLMVFSLAECAGVFF